MDVDAETAGRAALEAENARLRERLAALERELAEQAARANAAVARAEERVLWLDRWHVDLNRLMARPWAAPVPGAMALLRRVVRKLKAIARRLTGR